MTIRGLKPSKPRFETLRCARRVTITEKGRSLISRALEQRMAQHRALNATLTLDERETLSGPISCASC